MNHLMPFLTRQGKSDIDIYITSIYYLIEHKNLSRLRAQTLYQHTPTDGVLGNERVGLAI
jgi:hypothetical protein